MVEIMRTPPPQFLPSPNPNSNPNYQIEALIITVEL